MHARAIEPENSKDTESANSIAQTRDPYFRMMMMLMMDTKDQVATRFRRRTANKLGPTRNIRKDTSSCGNSNLNGLLRARFFVEDERRLVYEKQEADATKNAFKRTHKKTDMPLEANKCARFLLFLILFSTISSGIVSSESSHELTLDSTHQNHYNNYKHHQQHHSRPSNSKASKYRLIDSQLVNEVDGHHFASQKLHPAHLRRHQKQQNSDPIWSPMFANKLELLRTNDDHEAARSEPRRTRRKQIHNAHHQQIKQQYSTSESQGGDASRRLSQPEPEAFRSQNLWTLVSDEMEERPNRWTHASDDLLFGDVDEELLKDGAKLDADEDDDGEDLLEEEEEEEDEEEDEDEEEEASSLERRRAGWPRQWTLDSGRDSRSSTKSGSQLYSVHNANDMMHQHNQRWQQNNNKDQARSLKHRKPHKVPKLTFTDSDNSGRRHHERLNQNHQQQEQQQLPRQLPIVVSISDNSFVSASPIASNGLEAAKEGEIGKSLGQEELSGGYVDSTVSTTATTTISAILDGADSSMFEWPGKSGRAVEDSLLIYNSSSSSSSSSSRSSSREPEGGGQVGENRIGGIFSSFTRDKQEEEGGGGGGEEGNGVLQLEVEQTRAKTLEQQETPAKPSTRSNYLAQPTLLPSEDRSLEGEQQDQLNSDEAIRRQSSNNNNNKQQKQRGFRVYDGNFKPKGENDFLTTTTSSKTTEATTSITTTDANFANSNDQYSASSRQESQADISVRYELDESNDIPTIVLNSGQSGSGNGGGKPGINLERVHHESEIPSTRHYASIVRSPINELDDNAIVQRQRHWHGRPSHKASIRIGQEQEPDEFHRGGINSALIAILFGIGATGMLVLIVGHKMRSIRERVAYRGRRRSLVPDTDFLIQTIPI